MGAAMMGGGVMAGGFHLADSWIHPFDLVAIGLMSAEESEQEAA